MHPFVQAGSGLSTLATAVTDAKQVEAVLRTVHGFQTCLLLDDAATKADIERALDAVRAKLGSCASNSRFIFFFAGHGIQVQTVHTYALACFLIALLASCKHAHTHAPAGWRQKLLVPIWSRSIQFDVNMHQHAVARAARFQHARDASAVLAGLLPCWWSHEHDARPAFSSFA